MNLDIRVIFTGIQHSVDALQFLRQNLLTFAMFIYSHVQLFNLLSFTFDTAFKHSHFPLIPTLSSPTFIQSVVSLFLHLQLRGQYTSLVLEAVQIFGVVEHIHQYSLKLMVQGFQGCDLS